MVGWVGRGKFEGVDGISRLSIGVGMRVHAVVVFEIGKRGVLVGRTGAGTGTSDHGVLMALILSIDHYISSIQPSNAS